MVWSRAVQLRYRSVGGVFVVAVCALGLAGGAAADHRLCVGTVDGDTLLVEIGGEVSHVHLWGIDAPELEQPWGPEAKRVLSDRAEGESVEIDTRGQVAEGQVAVIRVEGVDLSRFMIDEGFAWLADSGSTSDEYAIGLFAARSKGVGMWSGNPTDLVHPAQWLEEHRLAAAATPPPTPVPSSLSDIAHGVTLEGSSASGAAGGGPMISNDDLRSMGLSLPDSEYSKCVRPLLAAIRGAVDDLRKATAGMVVPERDSRKEEKMYAAKRLIPKTANKIQRCAPSRVEGEGASLLYEAALHYESAAKIIDDDVSKAWLLMNEGDELINRARIQFNASFSEKQKQAAESNQGKPRW